MPDETAMIVAAGDVLIDASAQPYRPLTWERALEQWLASLDSENTVRNYRATIMQLFSVPGMPQHIADVNPEILTAWRGAMVARAHLAAGSAGRLSPATVNRHLSAARAFFNYWRDLSTGAAPHVTFTGDAQKRALKAMRAKVEKPFAVLGSDEEIAALIDAAGDSGVITQGVERIARKTWERKGDATADRDALIITVALASGLRCAELAALNVGSLSHQSWTDETGQVEAWALDVKAGKGHKDRQVWISTDDAQAILDYLTSTGRKFGRPADADIPLFLSTGNRNKPASEHEKAKGGRMATNSIRRIIDAAADRAQAAGRIGAGNVISPHSLRHTYAISLLRGDAASGRRPATIMEVKEMLGHADIRTTQRYLDHLGSRERAGLAPSISRLRHRA